MHIPKWLIAAVGLLFVGLLAAVAFFLGRETSRPPAPASAAAAPATPAPAAPAPDAPAPAPAPMPQDPAPAIDPPQEVAKPSASASAPVPAADTAQTTPEARARVAAYFKQMDAIQAGGQTGDQQEFASSLVNAAGNGDFTGIDDLVRAADEADRRAAAIQPPSECAEYHRMAVSMLQESRNMVASIREGLKRNDTNALTALSTSAQQMKSRADDLAKAEKALRARYGL
jgi:2-oxoglutarate dehydrogenase E2 component (dihydrolipoamide succinyltransferase)